MVVQGGGAVVVNRYIYIYIYMSMEGHCQGVGGRLLPQPTETF